MYKYLEIIYIFYPSIGNLKCTLSNRQIIPRLGTPALNHGSYQFCFVSFDFFIQLR